MFWVIGACAAHWVPRLPDPAWWIALTAVSAAGLWWRTTRLPAALLLGIGWTLAGAHWRLEDRLPKTANGQDITVEGRIVGLPQQQTDAARFDVAVTHWQAAAGSLAWSNREPRVRVSWYGHSGPISPGSTFRGVLRVRTPYALVNPGGFDFERHALVQGIDANAYVRQGELIAPADGSGRLDRLRQHLATWIRERGADPALGALLAALAVGDQQAIDDTSWARLRTTGTTHLMAISGLHIGLAAAALAWLSGWIYRIWPTLALRVIRPDLMAIAGVLGAVAYGCLASFSLPVLRTVIMIAVVAATTLSRTHVRTADLLLIAAFLALLIDPLAPLAAGFWLSFLGVWCLILVLDRDPETSLSGQIISEQATFNPPSNQDQSNLPDRRRRAPRRRATATFVTSLLCAQWAASVFLLPIGIAWFDQASLVGPVANLLAIPVITFIIVPLLLAALLCSALPLGGWIVDLAGGILSVLWRFLGWCEQWPMASVDLPEPTLTIVALALFGALLWLLPRSIPGKVIGFACLLPLFWPRQEIIPPGQAQVSILDVGQGLSILVRTRQHALLYDAGANSRNGFDLGEAAVAPALRGLGVGRSGLASSSSPTSSISGPIFGLFERRSLDLLVISHLDNDHAGGREAVLRAFPGTRQRVGIEADPAPRCLAGQTWQWDDVRFRFVHPPMGFPDLGNESSCMLLVEAGGERLLITGDIGHDIESRLRSEPLVAKLSVLIVPHHGSRHSSSAEFLALTSPKMAIVSAGFGNRFGHPSKETLDRYGKANIPVFDTGDLGMINLTLGAGALTPMFWRSVHPRYWRHTGGDHALPQ